MQLLWLAAILAVVSSVLVFLLNGLAVWYYTHPKEKSALALLVTMLGMTVSQLSIVVIPVDVYNASFSSPETYETMSFVLQASYYGLFLAVIGLSAVVIPFAYFFVEASFVEDEDTPTSKKIITGVKYAFVPFVMVLALLFIGLFLHSDHITDLIIPTESTEEAGKMIEAAASLPFTRNLLQVNGSSYEYNQTSDSTFYLTTSSMSSGEEELVEANTALAYNYLEELLDSNILEYSISFTYFVITAAGFVLFWVTYTAMGMASASILLLKGTKRLEGEVRDLQAELENVKETASRIQNKYAGKMPDKARKQFDDANYEAEQLEGKLNYLEELQQSTFINKVKEFSKPAMFILGAILLVTYGAVIISLLFTQIDRFRSSDCGWSCGFVITSPQLILNPLDMALTYSSRYFPLDLATFALIVVSITFGTLAGLLTFGIRFAWIKMFSVRPKGTVPQALLASSLIVMLTSICLMIEILSIAPQYATFGSRSYISEEGEEMWCNMSAGADACPMTEIAQIVNRFYASLSIAGTAFYFGTWLFIVMFGVGIFFCIFKKRSNVAHLDEEDLEDYGDDDL